MGSLKATRDVIEARFELLIAGPQAVPVVYDNEDEPTAAETWIRASIVWGEAETVELGSDPIARTMFSIMAATHTRIGSGSGTALEILDAIGDAFRAVTDTGVAFLTPRPLDSTERGQLEPNPSSTYVAGVSCPGYFERRKSEV